MQRKRKGLIFRLLGPFENDPFWQLPIARFEFDFVNENPLLGSQYGWRANYCWCIKISRSKEND